MGAGGARARWGWRWPVIHPSLVLVAGLAVVSGRAGEVVVLFGSVLAHELGHSLVGRLFGLRLQRITLYPFGGVAELAGLERASPRARLATLVAGPLVSLLLFLAGGWLAGQAGPESPWGRWGGSLHEANRGLLVANLLPVGPLDGGRMVEVALERRVGVGVARRWLMGAGVGTGVGLGLVGLGGLATGRAWGSLLLLGAFLAVAARREARTIPFAVLRWALGGPRPLTLGPARLLAAPRGARVWEVAGRLGPGPYRLVVVVGPRGRVAGFLGEGTLMDALAGGRGEARLEELLEGQPCPHPEEDQAGAAGRDGAERQDGGASPAAWGD
ncbi:M50 family metallopeptidase [Limnochorda pilosa]|uniref:M50 family metallopeptidase n=3 Tax=Limnochorda TaxID=1676651 RepID=UPI0026F2253A|nr:M50 family metallopeptidase [Limnochorda pilosa]